MDHFAAQENIQCPLFFSLFGQVAPLGVDAHSVVHGFPENTDLPNSGHGVQGEPGPILHHLLLGVETLGGIDNLAPLANPFP